MEEREFVELGIFEWVIGILIVIFSSAIGVIYTKTVVLETAVNTYKDKTLTEMSAMRVDIGMMKNDISWIKTTLGGAEITNK